MAKPRNSMRRLFLFSLVVLLGLAAATFALLKHGLTLPSINIANLRVQGFQLRLAHKLELDIAAISLLPTASPVAGQNEFDPSRVRDLLRAVEVLGHGFSAIDIHRIEAGPLSGSFRYRASEDGYLRLNSDALILDASLVVDREFLNVEFHRIELPAYRVEAVGRAQVDTRRRELRADLDGEVADMLPLRVEIIANRTQLTFSGEGLAPVSELAPIVDLFKLGPRITPWISEYLVGRQISLKTISGTIPYRNPAAILQNLYAQAQVLDGEYTFAQGLEPIVASEIGVVFEEGVLNIYPHDATFYGQDGGDSYLDIDFNDGRFMLTAYIRTSAQVSGGVITLLDHYGIGMPLEQLEGLTDTDLTLGIDLASRQITADGRFGAKDGVFEFKGMRFHVSLLDVGLRDTVVTIDRLDLTQPGRLAAHVSGELDPAARWGDMDVAIERFVPRLGKTALTLLDPEGRVMLAYHRRPDGDTLDISASSWVYGDVRIDAGPFTTPFDPSTYTGVLPPVPIHVEHWLHGHISGSYNGQELAAKLQLEIGELLHEDVQLGQASAQVEIQLGEDLVWMTKSPVRLAMLGQPGILRPLRMSLVAGEVRVEAFGLSLERYFDFDLEGYFQPTNGEGRFRLDNGRVGTGEGGEIFSTAEPIWVALSLDAGGTHLHLPDLDLNYHRDPSGDWSFTASDLTSLQPHSPLMQRYGLGTGQFSLTASPVSADYLFSGSIHYPHAILVEGNTPVYDYQFQGHYGERGFQLDINDNLHVDWKDKIRLTSAGVGYNLLALGDLLDMLKSRARAAGETGGELSLDLRASDSFVYLNASHRVIADSLSVRSQGGKTTGEFVHKAGFATLYLEGDTLSLTGEDFGPEFFGELIAIADFENGAMEFSLLGTLEDMDAIFRIEDTIIKDYKHLNNMLALVNTVPGLLTFNLPDYNAKGLPARELYTGMHYGAGIVSVDTLSIDSDELSINGVGSIDFNNLSVDMDFNLITGAKKSISRIPLVGYILTGGEEKPSISLHVEGDMDDPEVSHTAYKQVATYPFQVLKRTVLLPDHMAKQVREKSDSESQPSDE